MLNNATWAKPTWRLKPEADLTSARNKISARLHRLRPGVYSGTRCDVGGAVGSRWRRCEIAVLHAIVDETRTLHVRRLLLLARPVDANNSFWFPRSSGVAARRRCQSSLINTNKRRGRQRSLSIFQQLHRRSAAGDRPAPADCSAVAPARRRRRPNGTRSMHERRPPQPGFHRT